MKVKDLIAELLKSNDLEDEIIATWWDKNYFIDSSDKAAEEVMSVWSEFVAQGQETLEGHLEFTQTGSDLLEELEEMITEREENGH